MDDHSDGWYESAQQRSRLSSEAITLSSYKDSDLESEVDTDVEGCQQDVTDGLKPLSVVPEQDVSMGSSVLQNRISRNSAGDVTSSSIPPTSVQIARSDALDFDQIDITGMSEEELFAQLEKVDQRFMEGDVLSSDEGQIGKQSGGQPKAAIAPVQAWEETNRPSPSTHEPHRLQNSHQELLVDPEQSQLVENRARHSLEDINSAEKTTDDDSLFGEDDEDQLFLPKEPKARIVGQAEKLEPLDESLAVPINQAQRVLKRGMKQFNKKEHVKLISEEDKAKADQAHQEALKQQRADRPRASADSPVALKSTTSLTAEAKPLQANAAPMPQPVVPKPRPGNILPTYGPAVGFPVMMIKAHGKNKLSDEESRENKRRSSFNSQEKKRQQEATANGLSYVNKTYASKLAGYPAGPHSHPKNIVSAASADTTPTSRVGSNILQPTRTANKSHAAPAWRGTAVPSAKPAEILRAHSLDPSPPRTMGLQILKPRDRTANHTITSTTLDGLIIEREAPMPTVALLDDSKQSYERKLSPSADEKAAHAEKLRKRADQRQELSEFREESRLRALRDQLARFDNGEMTAREAQTIMGADRPIRTAASTEVSIPVKDADSDSDSVPSEEGETAEEYATRLRTLKAGKAEPFGSIEKARTVPHATHLVRNEPIRPQLQSKPPVRPSTRPPTSAQRSGIPAWIRNRAVSTARSDDPEPSAEATDKHGHPPTELHAPDRPTAVLADPAVSPATNRPAKRAVDTLQTPRAKETATKYPRLSGSFLRRNPNREGANNTSRSTSGDDDVPALTPDQSQSPDAQQSLEVSNAYAAASSSGVADSQDESTSEASGSSEHSAEEANTPAPTPAERRARGEVSTEEYVVRYSVSPLSSGCPFVSTDEVYGGYETAEGAGKAAAEMVRLMQQQIATSNYSASTTMVGRLPIYSFVDEHTSICASVRRKTVWRLPARNDEERGVAYYEVQQRTEVLAGWYEGEKKGVQQVSHGSFLDLPRANQVAKRVWEGAIGGLRQVSSEGNETRPSSDVERDKPDAMDISDLGESSEQDLFWQDGTYRQLDILQEMQEEVAANARCLKLHVWVEKKILKGL